MRLLGGTASHVGNVREANQDRVYFNGRVAALADGMGGHQGGERAAELAIGQFRRAEPDLTEEDLVEVVLSANRQVHGHAADNGLPGMGTTLVALTLHADSSITVANVGDSRAYWVRDDVMGQITEDHSFVEDLVRQGRLTPEEAAIHPQRNILTRAVGIGAEVEVDRFPITEPEIGDRFLLCSDGLFNELSEERILRIFLESDDPTATAEALVAATLETPCRDNVTVAVVELVADDDARLESQVLDHEELGEDGLATDEFVDDENAITAPIPVVSKSTLHHPGSDNGNGVGPANGTAPGGASRRAATLLLDDDGEPSPDDDPDIHLDASDLRVEHPTPARVRPRSRLAVVVGSLLLVAGVLGGAWFLTRAYARSGYFIDEGAEGRLAVFEGRQGGFLWFDPVEGLRSEQSLEVLEAVFDAEEIETLTSARYDDRAEAREALGRIDEQIEERLAEAAAADGADGSVASTPSDGTAAGADGSDSGPAQLGDGSADSTTGDSGTTGGG